MPEDANTRYLQELLKQAERDNEQARLYQRSSISEEKQSEAKDAKKDAGIATLDKITDNTAPSQESEQQGEKKSELIRDEAAEIMSAYSVKSKEKPFSNTQSLRESLEKQMQENKELLGYFEGTKARSKSKKVDELYTLINEANTQAQTDIRKTPFAGLDQSRLSEADADTVPQKPEYTQEQMFYFGDTRSLEEESQLADSASFDSDYEQLTDKITSGELDFSEDEDENQLTLLSDEADELVKKPEEKLDETDINLRLAFDMMDENRQDIDEFLKKEKEKAKELKKAKEELEDKEYEYTSHEQNSEIASMLKKAIHKSRIKLLSVSIIAFIIFFIELATPDSSLHLSFLKPGKLGYLYILIDLQLLYFIALIMLSYIKHGIDGIIRRKLNTDSFLVLSLVFTTLYSIVMLIANPTSESLKLYSFPGAAAAVCAMAVNYLNSKKDYHCFRVLAAKKSKYVAAELDGNTNEANEFYKYLIESSDLYTVKRTQFVSGFINRTKKRAKGEDLFNFLVPAIVIAGMILFGVIYYKSSLFTAFTDFVLLVLSSVPLAAFFMIPMPVIAANKKGERYNTAFIGNAVTEEYADASVLSFADTEVYPSHLVKITSLKTYGDFRIDKIIPDLSKIFSYIGGPLDKVLKNALAGEVTPPRSVRLIESAADGICVSLDGSHIFLGKKSYMRRYRFETPVDADDEMYEKNIGSIMYVVMDDELAAKVYIKYTLNPLFDSLLKDMYKAGLCLGIKTLDPNINNDLLEAGIGFKKCPIAILKAYTPEDLTGESESIDSGIVSNASLHTFLKMFVLCDKTRHITKSNAIITIASVFLSFFAAAFLAVTGDFTEISSFYLVLLQFIWLLPVWFTSLFL
jgi:hypothetical protein